MNTPTHITLALATLGRKDKPKMNPWIFAGALIPDAALFGLFVYEVMIGTPQRVIWNEKYFGPLWQNTVDVFNSLPFILIILVIALQRKWIAVQLFCYAALLHIGTDFLTHNDDGHRHLFPLSEFRFESPVSYWDPNHFGGYFSVFELLLLCVTTYIAFYVLQNKWARYLLLSVVFINVLLPFFFIFTLS